jgi:hypothetical protein
LVGRKVVFTDNELVSETPTNSAFNGKPDQILRRPKQGEAFAAVAELCLIA